MNLDTGAFRDDEIEVLRAGEIADARMGNVGGFVSCDDVVPYTHRSLLLLFNNDAAGCYKSQRPKILSSQSMT